MDKYKLYRIKKFLYKLFFEFFLTFTIFKASKYIDDGFNYNIIQEYNSITDDFSDFLNENDIIEPSEIFDYYSYALWNGYLSNNHKFEYDVNRAFLIDYYGLDCIDGKAVCLNEADMLTDIYRKFGYEAYTIGCYVDVDHSEVNPIRCGKKIERSINDDANDFITEFFYNAAASSNVKFISKIFGNHAITCVKYNDEYYFYDPTRLAYLGKIDYNKVNIINGDGFYKLMYLSTAALTSDFFNPNIIVNNNCENYSDEIIEKNIEIKQEELESFYLNECSKYEYISENMDSNKQFIHAILSLYISQEVILYLYKAVNKIKNRKLIHNYDELINEINVFLEENNVTDFYNKVNILNEMINEGYISFKNGQTNEMSKTFNAISLGCYCILNNKFNNGTLIKDVLKDLNIKLLSVKSNSNSSSSKNRSTILCIGIDNDLYFYDYNSSLFLNKTNNLNLDSSDNKIKYKLSLSKIDYKYKIIKYRSNKDKVDELNANMKSLNTSLYESFYEQQKDKINSISEKLILEKVKK